MKKTTRQSSDGPIILNAWSARQFPDPGQKFFNASLTEPDKALTPRQLLKRHAQGLSLEGGRDPIFEEEGMETSGINPRTLDLVDLQEMREANAKRVAELKQKIEDQEVIDRKTMADRQEEADKLFFEKVKQALKDEGQH